MVFFRTLDDDVVVTSVFRPPITKFILATGSIRVKLVFGVALFTPTSFHILIHFRAHRHSMLDRNTGVLARFVRLSRNAYYCCE
jgi:hypothetical protein